MTILAHRLFMPSVIAVVLFGGLWFWSEQVSKELGDTEVISGWFLFCLMLFLGAFNVRKKLAAFNLGRVRAWLAFHVVGGLLAIAVFVFHTALHSGGLWPTGLYEQFIAALFWSVTATGFLGLAIIVTYPKRLTDSGREIIYERIPDEIYQIRESAEAEVVACTEESGESTLADHYEETLDWYFRRPRFYVNYVVGGNQAEAWLRSHGDAVRRYLSDKETPYLNRLLGLAEQKAAIDRQYACQDVMRKWLVVHIPLSVGLIAMSVWHLLLVYVYAQ